MPCIKPIYVESARSAVACGQCQPCRIRRKREWTARMLLESIAHRDVCFVTLTYRDEDLPTKPGLDGAPVATLLPGHLERWVRKLRRRGHAFRYFAVGEYGDQSWRPHYHAIMFGLDAAKFLPVFERTWERGFVSASHANGMRMAYTAGYAVKKMTAEDDDRLNGRHPEFRRMSLKPTIGYPGLDFLEEVYRNNPGMMMALRARGDIFATVRFQGKRYPLDAYITRKLRERLGVPVLAEDRDTLPIEEYERREWREQAMRKTEKEQRRSRNHPQRRGAI